MILFITLALLPVLLAQKDCDSCCPAPSTDGDAVSCSNLADKIEMLQNAINLSLCGKDSGSSSADDADVCMTVTMKAIPPCMLKEGSTAQSQCLIEAAKAISKELPGADEASGLEIVKKCKCDAFRKMWNNLKNVREMICVDENAARAGKNYQQQPSYGGHAAHHPAQYGANTLWFQYAMCQGLDFSCYFFTNNWNQGDFGQYYLYDNLLGDGNLLGGDNSLLPILALSGGLSGGHHGGYHGGHHGGHHGGNNIIPLLALSGGFGNSGSGAEAGTNRRRRHAGEDDDIIITQHFDHDHDDDDDDDRMTRHFDHDDDDDDDDDEKRRRRRSAEKSCSSYNDCDDGFACVDANASKLGECREM